MRIVLATTNEGKLKELRQIASDRDWLELELAPEGFEPVENGSTYMENAIIKARESAILTGKLS
ncbi:MAG: non-canonical purine NTP pyrophosphatase, partial [Candidatus Obscuribacterales bacterium]|nr:non-canonical purine NTP pyrophosphatase [Candidatus Obscuribacterales bacterium]